MYIQNKITGRTADSYYEVIPQYDTIKAFLSGLTLQYGNVGVAEDVITQLGKIKQLQDESAMEFGQRVQSLCEQLQAIIEASDRGPHEKEDRKQEGAEIGLREFIFGLRPPKYLGLRPPKYPQKSHQNRNTFRNSAIC
jgi:hypothetical protein